MSRAGIFSCAGICAALLLAACGTKAADQTEPQPVLPLTGRVVDAANVLDPAVEQRLIKRLAAIEHDVGAQFVVATTPSLNDRPIESYSLDLARSWALGRKDHDDGLLLLVAPNERKVRIEVGIGLERQLADEYCAKVIRENILPAFRSGDLPAGIEGGVDALDVRLRRPAGAKNNIAKGKAAA